MPGPWSVTSMQASPSRRRARTEMRVCGEDAQGVAHFAAEFRELHRLRLNKDLATLHPGQREERFDEVVEALRFFQHAADGLAQSGGIVALAQRNLPYGTERSQRSAELMRSVRRKSLEFHK